MRRVLIPTHVPTIAPLASRAAQLDSLAGETMGTTWSVKIAASAGFASGDIQAAIEDRLATVIDQMSQWNTSSHISRFNRAASGEWHVLPDGFFRVLGFALQLARETDGAYDPTLGALSELWGFGAAGRRDAIPKADEVSAALGQVGWSQIVTRDDRRAVMQPGGILLDLSSIAKGHAVDLVSETLLLRGFNDHLVEIGGELRGSGVKPDHSPWWVALEDESGREDDIVVALHGMSVATSGDTQRFIAAGGRTYSHTIDPRSGWPIAGRLASVTVLDRSCMRADALATALSVLGADAGRCFATERDIAARFLVRGPDGIEELTTPAFAAMLS